MNVGTLLLRATIGPFFIGHGAQKLFGVAGGHGIKGTGQYFESLGLKPGTAHATLAGVGETAGGAGLLLGYRTPLAASAIVATMTTAIQRVHGKNGWSIQDGGFEYNAVLIAAAVAIAEQGPGVLSLDALRGKQRKGIVWGALALGLGVGGSALSSVVAGAAGGSGQKAAGAQPPVPRAEDTPAGGATPSAEAARHVGDAVPGDGPAHGGDTPSDGGTTGLGDLPGNVSDADQMGV